MPHTLKKPAIVLETVMLQPMTVLYIKDTTAIGKQNKTVQKDFDALLNFISKHALKAGRIMAFYLNFQNPLLLEAAVEIDKLPAELTGNINAKKTEGGLAIIAHYTGPYQKMGIAYNAITSMMDENKKLPKGLPFEVYINDAATVKNKQQLQTDIYQLLQ